MEDRNAIQKTRFVDGVHSKKNPPKKNRLELPGRKSTDQKVYGQLKLSANLQMDPVLESAAANQMYVMTQDVHQHRR